MALETPPPPKPKSHEKWPLFYPFPTEVTQFTRLSHAIFVNEDGLPGIPIPQVSKFRPYDNCLCIFVNSPINTDFYQSWTTTLFSSLQDNYLCCVQISHLALMASNRNSICDIWSHKTINSDREIVNSIPPLCISFSDVNLISYPISLTSPVYVL